MDHMQEKLQDHFCSNVLAVASRLQSSDAAVDTPATCSLSLFPAEQFGEELLQCIKKLSAPMVRLLVIECLFPVHRPRH